ncbi:conserved hypothetical protein [Leptothrix cholodnii SP-6]|uniref:Solute-binding protein family 3/N-terminal domain-containing protein n=1 Tax=Leptothrix cholodnii (strain ATCC 51168 / LMG 8142 / SP-6) TaxID=395495 RepID=B1Y5R2_LEPCP|nr:hypothetical protein [Leptothrix cholodnii]ACB35958.1 conserved hypothetical protein [Leptothrix cholodnii SP-6]
MTLTRESWRCRRFLAAVALLFLLLFGSDPLAAAPPELRTFPAGPIYDYRWKLLELALAQTAAGQVPPRLQPYADEITQNRAVTLLQAGAIDVIALGTNPEREARLLPIRIDILRGIVGFRLLVIRSADQPRIAAMDAQALRSQLEFGLNSQWADLPIMRANGYSVTTSSSYENLFVMLSAGRFDAFPRGLNEARRELAERHAQFPDLVIESSKALFFAFPIYFWVNPTQPELARRIERGLRLALADGSFRKLFEAHHAADIAALQKEKRQVITLDNPNLPAGSPAPDTSWWWPAAARTHRP